MARTEVSGFVLPLCEKLAVQMGCECIDAELVREGAGRYLRIYLDKSGGVSLDDCERFHRAVQPQLERVDYDFLEVCSPGLDRPIKTERDFARMKGAQVEVRLYKAQGGAKAFIGALSDHDEKSVEIETPGGVMRFERRGVAVIKPFIDFVEGESDP